MAQTDLLGAWGEALAVEHLRHAGWYILTCNYRCRMGEIDVIARKESVLAFVEVKLRKSDFHGQAREFVDGHKQQRIRTTARYWLSDHPDCDLQPRFDVIELYAPQGTETKNPRLIHLENAFE